MKNALNMSDIIVKDVQKIAKIAYTELFKYNKNNDNSMIRKLNNEIEILVKRKEMCTKLRKEIDSKERLLNVREKLKNKKK